MSIYEIIKWSAVVLSLGGWSLVTYDLLLGLMVAAVGSSLWVYIGARMKEPSVAVLNLFFVAIQSFGVIKLIL